MAQGPILDDVNSGMKLMAGQSRALSQMLAQGNWFLRRALAEGVELFRREG